MYEAGIVVLLLGLALCAVLACLLLLTAAG
jgi:hypothetical protein